MKKKTEDRKLITVSVSSGTKASLEALKTHPRETMDDVIARLLELERKSRPVTNCAPDPAPAESFPPAPQG